MVVALKEFGDGRRMARRGEPQRCHQQPESYADAVARKDTVQLLVDGGKRREPAFSRGERCRVEGV